MLLLISTSIVADMRSTVFIHIDDKTETCVVSVRVCVCERGYVCRLQGQGGVVDSCRPPF